jgi:mono/diheme cytochrome c family protein
VSTVPVRWFDGSTVLAMALLLTLVATGAAAVQEGTTASVWDGVYSEEQAKRGEIAYRQSCVNCHGPELEGADMTPPLVGGVFTSNWNDLTLGDLFERVRATMPLDKPGSLSRQQNADLVAFLLKANQWPVGTSELSRELGALKQIRIQSTKPERKP